jgi:hypothetical protein
MIRNLLTLAISSVFVFLSQRLAAPMQTKEPGTSVSLCQILSQPEHYLDGSVTIRVRVRTYRHGTSISDSYCPKRAITLIADDSALKNDDVNHFYRFLSERRQSTVPIDAILTGRTARGSDGGFVVNRAFVFKLESVAEVAEANQQKKR